MTITSSTNRSPLYTSAGTGPFAFTFKTFDEEDLTVILVDGSGVETTLTLTTDYTVTLNADQNNSPGGEVTLASALVTGEALLIMREVDATQGTDIQNMGGFYPEVIEDALDRLTMLVQQNAEKITRALVLSAASTVDPDTLLAQVIAGCSGVFSKSYSGSTAALTDATSDLITVPHALGVVPRLVKVMLECLTASAGWTAGERVEVGGYSNGALGGFVWYADATNIYIRTADALLIPTKTTGAAATVTESDWAFYVEAFA